MTKEQEPFVQSLVSSGRYHNASEVIREGLRLIERREAEDAAKLEALRAAADVGIADLERGDFKQFADRASLKAYLNGLADEALRNRTKRR